MPVNQVPIIFLGLGNVGKALLRQILGTRDMLANRTGLRLVPIGLADISGLLFNPDGLTDKKLQSVLQTTADGSLLDALPGIRPLSELGSAMRAGTILADLTASPKTEPTLRAALESECSVVLANKIPLSGPWTRIKYLFSHKHLRYEVTVGAGLPVVNTLRSQLDTGDLLLTVEGCFSGTLGYLCSQLDEGSSFSAAVTQAHSLKYTEPDPRDDLGGQDVARKALILARTAGWPLEMDDLTIEPLFPPSLAAISPQEFLEALPTLDEQFTDRVQRARAEGAVLRYMAHVGPSGGRVGLTTIPKDSPLGALSGPANYIALQTRRYQDLPLVLSGPGAGPEVTAAGVYADIISLTSSQTFSGSSSTGTIS